MAAKKKDTKTGTDRDGAGVAPEHGDDGAEVAEDRVQVVERAAAIDVAKGFGMVCTGSRAAARIAGGRRCGGWRPPTRR